MFNIRMNWNILMLLKLGLLTNLSRDTEFQKVQNSHRTLFECKIMLQDWYHALAPRKRLLQTRLCYLVHKLTPYLIRIAHGQVTRYVVKLLTNIVERSVKYQVTCALC